MAANGTKSSQTSSKATKKKVAAERTVSPSPLPSPAPEKSEVHDDSNEHPLIRDIQKTMRNVNKKLTNASKTDSLIAQHKGKTLDELVAGRIINTDQKAQILKKPALKEQLAQLEEKQTLLAKMQADVESTVTATLTDKFEKEKAEVVLRAEGELKQKFMTLSMFLRFVADRRSEGADQTIEENAALEGLLSTFFGGDQDAVSAMHKLVDGADEPTLNTSGETLEITYAQVKTAAEAHMTSTKAVEVESETAAAAESDPTIANIAATEIAAGDTELSSSDPAPAVAESNGVVPNESASPETAQENGWATATPIAPQLSTEQVEAPKADVPAEETPHALVHTTSWADDQPDPVPETQAAPPTEATDDGFTAVQRNKPRNESNWRGRGRGEWRGRGRGEGRGRGRGRGMAHRGGPRREEA